MVPRCQARGQVRSDLGPGRLEKVRTNDYRLRAVGGAAHGCGPVAHEFIPFNSHFTFSIGGNPVHRPARHIQGNGVRAFELMVLDRVALTA